MANAGGRIGYVGGGIFKLLKMLKSKPKPKSNKLSEQDVAALKKKYGLDPESLKKDDEAFKLRLQEILAKHSTKHAEGGMIRTGFKKGGDMSRRGFMKLIAGIAALPVIGKYFKAAKLAKPAAKAVEAVVTMEKTAGMPAWFPALVNRVIKQGDDVTKKLGTVEREMVHTQKIKGGEEVTVYRNLDTGNVRVEYADNVSYDPVHLEYKAPEVIESGKVSR